MPINRSHAFGGAGVVQHPRIRLMKAFLAMRASPELGLKLLVTFFMHPITQYRAAQVWRRFNQFSRIESNCWLGVNAWCSSYEIPKKSDMPIVINKNTVIRGLLRIEVGGNISIGRNSYIGDDTIIDSAKSIEIGNYTMLAHGIHVFDNDSHPCSWQERLEQSTAYREGKAHLAPRPARASVRIGSHVWIGFNAFISKGVTIGDRSIVAAGSVVTKDVPPDTVVAGIPARVVRSLNDQEERAS